MAYDLHSAIAAHNAAIESVANMAAELADVVARIRQVFASGGRVFICGNGGSASDAQHFAAELTGRFEKERRGYPAIALTTDTSALTSIGNDYGFDHVFSRQLEALGQTGDILIAISTSGNSGNVLRAVEYAREQNIQTVGLLGRDGGRLQEMVDVPLIIRAERTARIQEAHILILHLICEAFEEQL